MARILIVDDDPDLREDLQWAAQGSGRDIVIAGSAKEAIETLTRESFDVVVTDMRMETNNAGLEVLKAAKERDILTQVIVITAYGTPEISVETMRLGAFDYLERNFPGTDVLAMIKSKVTLALDFRNAKLRESGIM
jgi:DNA-binding NtrC family response regulator